MTGRSTRTERHAGGGFQAAAGLPYAVRCAQDQGRHVDQFREKLASGRP
jgi:hypothetical protein